MVIGNGGCEIDLDISSTSRSQVTEPRIAAPPLDVRKPAAGRIKRDHHEHPDQINHGQRKPPSGWSSERKVCNVWGFKHPVSLPVTRVTHDDCQQMNEWDVQQKIKHRYLAEDQRRPQETRSGRVHDIKEQQRWRIFVGVQK